MHAIDKQTETRESPSLAIMRRRVRVLLPLFSIRTEENLGIGELLDLLPFIDFMADHHLSLLQILPIYETTPEETCPYQALSSFARDPVYLSLGACPDIQKAPETKRFFANDIIQRDLLALRSSPRVCYEQVRCLKNRLLRYAFQYFKTHEWQVESERAIAFQAFAKQKSIWLDDYALFRLLKERYLWSHWRDWPESVRNRDKSALEKLEQDEVDELLFIKYLQWLLSEQWQEVQAYAKEREVLLMGDILFLISHDSADVWSESATFSSELTVGVPPDAFSTTGQDWGLPLFDWNEMLSNDFRWWRMRIAEVKDSVDLIRLDHVVGYFRVWVMPKDGESYFEPLDEHEQLERGALLLNVVLQELGDTMPVAEDLGIIPDAVSRTLEHLGISGMKVLRWEKIGDHFIDPREFPVLSLATTGTHDTAPLRSWWSSISIEERAHFLNMLQVPSSLASSHALSDELHREILRRILSAGSQWVVLPIQDILGEEARINTPATVGRHNWRYRMPIPLVQLRRASSPYRKKLTFLRELIDLCNRF